MPRALFVLGITAAGGAENQCRYVLEALHRRGVDVEFVCFRPGRLHDRFEALGVPVHIVPAKRMLALDWYQRARGLRRLVGDHPPDIVHTWLYEAHQVGLVASAAWPTTGVVLSHRSGSVLPRDRKHLAALRLLRKRIDHVIANSDAGAEIFTTRIGVSSDRVSVIPNGIPPERVTVDEDRDSVRSALGIGRGAPIICSVGRTDHQRSKDYPTLMAAMAAVWSRRPDAELIVVGPSPSDLVQELGAALPPRVHVLGWQPHPAHWLNAADIVAVHSRTEGHSNVADEALMLGLPVAATDTGGHPAFVRQAGGRVVPVGRGDLLGAAILALLDDPPSRASVSRIAHEALSIDHVAGQMLDVYERLAAVKGPPAPSYGSARAPA